MAMVRPFVPVAPPNDVQLHDQRPSPIRVRFESGSAQSHASHQWVCRRQ